MAKQSEWAKRVRRWRQSGLTSQEFAAREGVNAGTLLWWSSKLQRERRSAEGIAFVEVAAVTTGPIEVQLRNGRVVRVPASIDDETLARLLVVAERT